jgi:hypothetical protein
MQLEMEKTTSGAAIDATQLRDRRRSAREMRQLTAWLGDSSGGVVTQKQQVVVNSLSTHGVGISSDKPLETDSAHWLVIADDRLHLSTRVRIVSTRPRGDGGCEAGAEFF